MRVHVGLRGQIEHTVGAADTAIALGSGDVPVLGTPRVLALLEAATVTAIAAALEPGQTSVGTRVELAHLAATSVGRTVRAEAELVEVRDRQLSFTVTLWDGESTVASGRVDRVVVERDRFVARSQRG